MENERSSQVFEIVETISQTSDSWTVRGLSYQSIHVGDTLFVVRNNSENEIESFRVKKIVTYNRNLAELGAGYTGELVLEGKGANTLPEATHLLRSKTRTNTPDLLNYLGGVNDNN